MREEFREALVARGLARVREDSRVPEPHDVRYGVRPWTPAQDTAYTRQDRRTGLWRPAKAGGRRPASECLTPVHCPVTRAVVAYARTEARCPHCLDRVQGEMCPGCHRLGDRYDASAEIRLAYQRARSKLFGEAGVRLETKRPGDGAF